MQAFDVLVVTGDAGMLSMLCRSISAQPALRVAGCCGAAEAERLIAETKPDVIALDMQMPGVDCAALINRLKTNHGAAIVAMSAVTGIALETLSAGAADFVYIPERGSNSDYGRFLADAVDRIKIAATLHSPAMAYQEDAEAREGAGIAVIAGASGGPVPLACIVSRLAQGGPAVLAVQWQTDVFCADFCASLAEMAQITVTPGEDGMQLLPGALYVAAGNRRTEVISVDGKPVLRLGGACRSRDEQAEALFASAAALYLPASGVLLYDSAAGENALKRLAARGMPAIKHNKNQILRDIDYRTDGGTLELPLEDIAAAMLS